MYVIYTYMYVYINIRCTHTYTHMYMCTHTSMGVGRRASLELLVGLRLPSFFVYLGMKTTSGAGPLPTIGPENCRNGVRLKATNVIKSHL